ncbi:MAG TPA: serine hydrolase domain-containing protein, partial [Chitinophagaceae bacterium]|nr:serine hydrolase domain-containing protein [Chitinophagaceae bacterium]
MKRTCLFLVILSATFLSATTSVSAQPEKATAAIQQLMQEEAVIGLSVAVVKNGNIIYNESFGWKNRETQTPLTNESIFRIASISKSFTATALMQLVEKGKLSLDDDVSNLVGFKVINPKYPDTKITLRHLLSHRSGINDSQGYFSLDAINPDKNPNWAKCYNDYEPGKGYQYCNLNFNMAGAILERATGERFDKHIQKKILKPMKLYGGYRIDGLDSTRFATIYEYDSAGNFKAAPAAYAPRREEIAAYVQGYSTPIFSPTGGMKISAADLARYMTMHM